MQRRILRVPTTLIIPFALSSILATLLGTLDATQLIRVDVGLTQVTAIVTDASGAVVTGLAADDFIVEEDGVAQKIELFSNEGAPVTLGFLVDRSGSMQYAVKRAVSAAASFLDAFTPQDEAFVGTFSSGGGIARDFTSNKESLFAALMNINTVEGGTDLFPALQDALNHVKLGKNTKRALVVFTDGGDSSNVPLSAIRSLARNSEVPIYGLGITGTPSVNDGVPRIVIDRRGSFKTAIRYTKILVPPKVPPKQPLTIDPRLSRIAAETGGRVFQVPLGSEPSELVNLDEKTVNTILAEVRGQYLLGYYSTSSKDKLHSVRVKTIHPEYSVRSRRNSLTKVSSPMKSGFR